jgi:hypothetical protein
VSAGGAVPPCPSHWRAQVMGALRGILGGIENA